MYRYELEPEKQAILPKGERDHSLPSDQAQRSKMQVKKDVNVTWQPHPEEYDMAIIL